MADPTRERPAIHVCLAGPSAPGLYGWVEVGAEEEGLPTRHVAQSEDDVVAAAFAAAQGSRFGIGVAIGQGRVVLHEAHMPPERPVLAFEIGANGARACRLMGGNAARLVVRLPLRLADELEESAVETNHGPESYAIVGQIDPAQVARIVVIVTRILKERGIA
jgi:Dehydratase medium subunit